MIIRFAMTIACCLLLQACRPSGGSLNQALRKGEQKVQPVIDALEGYKASNGQYPASLDALVRTGLMRTFVDVDDINGMDTAKLRYRVADDGSIYVLSFGYNRTRGMGPGDFEMHSYVSEDRKWTTAQDHVPDIERLQADRHGTVYRKTRTVASLASCIEHLVKSARPFGGEGDCIKLDKGRVLRCLGGGDPIRVPDGWGISDFEQRQYTASDSSDTFVIVFKPGSRDGRGVQLLNVERVFHVSGPADDLKWVVLYQCR